MEQTLQRTLRRHAAGQPEAPAVLCDGRRVTYAALHAESSRVAGAIRAAGLGAGARIAYLGKESEHYYETLFGCAQSGTVLVPINWRLTPAEVGHIVRDSGSALLLVDPDLADAVERIRGELPGLRDVVRLDRFRAWTAAYPDAGADAGSGPDDPIVQLYTSGTTGLPKGVVLAQRSFFAIGEALAGAGLPWIDWRAGDRSLVGIPGFHVGGIWWAVQGFTAGITNVVMPRFDSRTALDLIRSLGVTTVCMVPAMLRLLLAEPDAGRDDLRTVRKVVYGGSPISETLLTRCLEVFDADFAQIYGLTETGNTAICLPPEDHKPGSHRLAAAGRPYPGVRVKVIGPDGSELPAGAVGEVCLHTPARMLGYWGLPEATRATLVDGWVHTGDAGHLDDDGYLYISDRLKDMIIVAGEKIYPTEVEHAVSRHPAVAEVAVIGVPDERFNEAVHAFVVLRDGHAATARDLMLFLRGQIAPFKLPQEYHFVTEVPRNPSGKILRRELRAAFWPADGRHVN